MVLKTGTFKELFLLLVPILTSFRSFWFYSHSLLFAAKLQWRIHPASHQHHKQHPWAFRASPWLDGCGFVALLHPEVQLGFWKQRSWCLKLIFNAPEQSNLLENLRTQILNHFLCNAKEDCFGHFFLIGKKEHWK